MKTESPTINQYYAFKEKYPDTILFMKIGDFFETFDNDAVIANKVLGLTLTKRSGIKMVGLPYYSINGYLKKLLEAGHKAGLCEPTNKLLGTPVYKDVVKFTAEN